MKKTLTASDNWYQNLLTDLRKLEFTGIVLTKHAIGKRILEDFEKFGKPEYGSKRVESLAVDLNIEKREIYRCIQFVEKYPKILTAWENSSWRDIANKLLPEPKVSQRDIIPLPKGKYQVIYADPPWMYAQEQHSLKEQVTTLETHYSSMLTEDICKLPIGELTGKNAVLFLWTTSPKLFEAKLVIDMWGFDYKSSMIWDKVKHNVGYYVSVRHEFLLICTKGSCLPDSKKLIDSVVSIERTKHSEKPDRFYEIIEEMYKGKKIELFARKKRRGWDSWGKEV